MDVRRQTKMILHEDSSTALDRSQAADKEEDEAGQASHRTREKLNMRLNELDVSGSTLVQRTNHDEGCAKKKKRELCK